MDFKITTSGKFGFDDREVLDVECPNGHSMRVTFGEVRRNATVRCSAGEEVKLEADQFNRELAKVEKSLNNLFK